MNKMKIGLMLVVLLVHLCGCNASISRYGYSINDLKANSESCPDIIITQKASFPKDVALIVGRVEAGDTGFSTDCSEAVVLNIFKKDACGLRANIINIMEETQPNAWSSCYRAKADLLRFEDKTKLAGIKSDSRYAPDLVNQRSKKTAIINAAAIGFGVIGAGIAAAAVSSSDQDVCRSSMKLEGTMSVESCAPSDKACIPASTAIYDYMMAAKVAPEVYNLYANGNPWHMYDGDMRILTIEEVAETVKSQLRGDVKRIEVIASWSGVAPDPKGKSLAQKLSDSLGGFPVSGMDGFVWLAKDGAVHTTHQAFTINRFNGPYSVRNGDDVMVSFAVGWLIRFEETFIKKEDAYGIMRVGAAYDVFMLCPASALRLFEAAAKLSNPIAAYNAALMRLERGEDGDIEAATKLLTQASKLGDKKAEVLLPKITRQGH